MQFQPRSKDCALLNVPPLTKGNSIRAWDYDEKDQTISPLLRERDKIKSNKQPDLPLLKLSQIQQTNQPNNVEPRLLPPKTFNFTNKKSICRQKKKKGEKKSLEIHVVELLKTKEIKWQERKNISQQNFKSKEVPIQQDYQSCNLRTKPKVPELTTDIVIERNFTKFVKSSLLNLEQAIKNTLDRRPFDKQCLYSPAFNFTKRNFRSRTISPSIVKGLTQLI